MPISVPKMAAHVRPPAAPARPAAVASDPYLRHGILLHILRVSRQ
jgi:hypothetical protein